MMSWNFGGKCYRRGVCARVGIDEPCCNPSSKSNCSQIPGYELRAFKSLSGSRLQFKSFSYSDFPQAFRVEPSKGMKFRSRIDGIIPNTNSAPHPPCPCSIHPVSHPMRILPEALHQNQESSAVISHVSHKSLEPQKSGWEGIFPAGRPGI